MAHGRIRNAVEYVFAILARPNLASRIAATLILVALWTPVLVLMAVQWPLQRFRDRKALRS